LAIGITIIDYVHLLPNDRDHRVAAKKTNHQETADPRLRCIALFG
jgi:hypothetical protein